MTLSMFDLRPRGRLQFVRETRSSRSRGESVRRESKRGKSGEMIKKLSSLFDFPFHRGGGADDVASEHRKILMGSPLSRSNLYCAVKRCRCNLSFKNGGHGAPLRAGLSPPRRVSLFETKRRRRKKSLDVYLTTATNAGCCSCAVPRR